MHLIEAYDELLEEAIALSVYKDGQQVVIGPWRSANITASDGTLMCAILMTMAEMRSWREEQAEVMAAQLAVLEESRALLEQLAATQG